MKCETGDGVVRNVDKIAAMFPQVVTEVKGEDGKITRAVKWDVLKELLSGEYVEGGECYDFTWPGKRAAIAEAAHPIRKTLRPCKAESKDWDTTENLYIEGDNLEVLKLLQESYLGKVKMIYIDPPYNTGNDFVYRDDFKVSSEQWAVDSGELFEDEETGEKTRMFRNTEANGRFHSDWCSMIYSRLVLARDLLSEDGVIFISIDDNEVENLKKICDEIFGEDNFYTQIIIQSNKRGQTYKQISKTHEYLLVYTKDIDAEFNELEKDGDSDDLNLLDSIGKFNIRELRNRNPKFGRHNRPNLYYPIYVNPTVIDKNGFCPISTAPDEGFSIEVYPINSSGGASCWRWGIDKTRQNCSLRTMSCNLVAKKKSNGDYNIYEKYRKTTYKPKTIWDDVSVITEKGTIELGELGLSAFFDFPKPLGLLCKILQIGTNPDDIILDFFSGSATTAHAVMQLNSEDGGKRKFIMVQLPEECPPDSAAAKAGYANICEIGKERIRRAGAKVVSDKWEVISKEEKARYGCKELSRADCLAEINGGGEGDLFAGQKTAEGGDVRAVGSNAAGGGVDPVEYRGGAGAELNKGVSAVSGDSAREHGGAGNATAVVRSSGIPCPYGHFGAHGQASGSEQNAECPYKNTIHCPLTTKHCPDVGFRVFKVADSNMKDVYFSAAEYKQESLDDFITNIKEDRTDLDLLYGCLLEWGVELSLPHTSEAIDGVTVHTVNNGDLIACFDPNIPESAIRAIAKRQPLRAVFRDSSFASAPQKINVEEIFKLLSPTTTVKVI